MAHIKRKRFFTKGRVPLAYIRKKRLIRTRRMPVPVPMAHIKIKRPFKIPRASVSMNPVRNKKRIIQEKPQMLKKSMTSKPVVSRSTHKILKSNTKPPIHIKKRKPAVKPVKTKKPLQMIQKEPLKIPKPMKKTAPDKPQTPPKKDHTMRNIIGVSILLLGITGFVMYKMNTKRQAYGRTR